MERFRSIGVKIHTSTKVTHELFNQIEKDFDAIVLAIDTDLAEEIKTRFMTGDFDADKNPAIKICNQGEL